MSGSKTSLKQAQASVKVAVNDIKSHFKVKDGKRKRDEKKKAKEANIDRIRQVQASAVETAAQAAARLRATADEGSAVAPVFKCVASVDVEHLTANKIEVCENADFAPDSPAQCFDRPFKTEGNIDVLAVHVGQQKILKRLEWWSNSMSTMNSWDSEKKAQFPLQENKGLTEWLNLIKVLNPVGVADIKDVSAAWADSAWMVAWKPSYSEVSMASNYSAQFRYLSMGHLKCMVIEIHSLAKELIKSGGFVEESLSLTNVFDALKVADADKIESWIKGGVKVVFYEQFANQFVWIPQGWVAVEQTCGADAAIHMGIRKNFMLKSAASIQNYKQCIALCSKEGVDLTRMTAIAAIMEA